jgi:hypothetical protein
MAHVFFSGEHGGINLETRCVMGASRSLDKMVKISWSADYEDVSVLIVNDLLPEGAFFPSPAFFISPNGEWATTYISTDRRRLHGELLKKRAFFHLDDRYPGGISQPVLTDAYEAYGQKGAFFKHPEYGWCYAKEHYEAEELYLRIYKMEDVLDLLGSQPDSPIGTYAFNSLETLRN